MLFDPVDFTGISPNLDELVAEALAKAAVKAEYAPKAAKGVVLRGAYGEELYATYFWIGNRHAKTVTVITTGLHGAEREIGSLFAVSLLANKSSYERLLGHDHALLIIDNLSPWSASHDSRFTAEGFDTNRQFGLQPKPSDGLPDGYAALDAAINIPHLTKGAAIRSIASVLWYRYQHGWNTGGLENLQGIIGIGQNFDADKIAYAGGAEGWTHLTLRQIIRTQLQEARHVIHMDIHTALGKWGHCVKVVIDDPDSQRYARATRLFITGEDEFVTTKRPNRYTRSDRRTIELAFYEELAVWQKYTGVCVEIGTLPINIVVAAMWLRDRVLRARFRDPDFFARNDHWSRRFAKGAFAPKNKRWRRRGLAHLHRLLRHIIQGVNDGIAAV